jgi:hypothetical protein
MASRLEVELKTILVLMSKPVTKDTTAKRSAVLKEANGTHRKIAKLKHRRPQQVESTPASLVLH